MKFGIQKIRERTDRGWKLLTPWFSIAAYFSPLGSYMHRWIVRTRGTLRLHHIMESDKGRDFHDHPFDFTSLVLKGGYIEHVPGCRCDWHMPEHRQHTPCKTYGPGSILRKRATDLHRLELHNGPAWTLVLTGPYWREWGFRTPAGWVHYSEYHRSYYLGEA